MKYEKRNQYADIDSLMRDRLAYLEPAINCIKGAEKAIDLIKKAVSENQHIHIVGDYDVDGICGTTIAYKGLTAYAKKVGSESTITPRLPKRQTEGYGLSPKIVEEIPEHSLLLTVDNGIVAFDAVKLAKKKKMTVIVTDHHLRADSGELPKADVLIDPNAVARQCVFTGYCGAGIALKLMLELDKDNTELNNELYVLAAIATVADVVPLKNENFVIAQFLKQADINKGLKALMELFEIVDVDEKDCGYKICPALNASGRLFDAGAEDSMNLLMSETDETASQIAEKLFVINEQRKLMTEEAVYEAEEIIERLNMQNDNPLCVLGDFHEGIIGIIAGRLAEKYRVPCFVFTPTENYTDNGDVIIKGSGRSYGDNNLKEILDNCKELLGKYGGHKAAAGVSMPYSNLDEFRKMSSQFAVKTEDVDVIYYDIEIAPNKLKECVEKQLSSLSICAPYGESNPEPVYLVRNVQLLPKDGKLYKLMGNHQQHIKLYGKNIDFVAFDLAEKFLELNQPIKIDLVGKLGKNYFNGVAYYQIEVIDFMPAEKKENVSGLREKLMSRAVERS